MIVVSRGFIQFEFGQAMESALTYIVWKGTGKPVRTKSAKTRKDTNAEPFAINCYCSVEKCLG
jgi:hypothetical protein